MMKSGSAGKIKAFILGAILLNSLGAGLLIPVVPRLVQALTGRGPESASFENGLLMSAFALTTFLFSPLLGRLSDRFGRRPVLLLATAGTVLDYALCAVAHWFPLLLVARLIAGMFGASSSVANAALADVTPPDERSRTFGLSSAVFGLGLILGPIIGGSVMTFGLSVPFIVACALAACEFAFGLFWFPETLAQKSAQPISLADVNPLVSLKRLKALPLSASLLLGVTLFQVGGTAANSVLLLFAQAKFGWSGLQVGALMTTLACTSVLIRSGGVRIALAWFGEKGAVAVGFGLFAGGLLAIGFVNVGWALYAAMIFTQLGTIAQPVVMGLLSRPIPSDMQGQAQGAISSVFALTSMAAPMIGALAYGNLGAQGAILGGEWVFVLCSASVLLGLCTVVWGFVAQGRRAMPSALATESANSAK